MNNNLTIEAADGFRLAATVYAADANGPVVIVNAAAGVARGYYRAFAEFLTSCGHTVVTYDYRGIGGSRPKDLRGFQARMRDWGVLDFEGVLQHVAFTFPQRRICGVGHSVGGQLFGWAPSNQLLSTAVTVASQTGHWRHWPLARQPLMMAIWYLALPLSSRVFGYLPRQVGLGEMPKGVALEWSRWARRRDFFLNDGLDRDGFERLSIPILGYSIDDDTYAPAAAVNWLHALYSNCAVRRVHLRPQTLGHKQVGHFGFFRRTIGHSLWKQVADALSGTVSSSAT